MSYSISAQEFFKQFVRKMASLITDNGLWGSIFAQYVSLNKPHNCVGIIYRTSNGFNPFGYIIQSKENVSISK